MSTSTIKRSSILGRTALTLAGGAVVAAGAFAASPAPQADAAGGWDQVAQCESSGNWSINTGNGFYGGLQFTKSTWLGYGGGQYASTADKATKSQQIAVAEKVLAGQGAGAWPNCGKYITGGADTSSSPSSDSSSSDSSSSTESRTSTKSDRSTERTSTSSTSKKSTEKQGDWSCDGDGIANNCTENGFTKKTESTSKKSEKSSTTSDSSSKKSSASTSKKSTEKQGDWSCDGDGIANNCTENGFTKKTESTSKKSESSAKSESSSKTSTSSSKSSVGNPDLHVAGTLEVDGKMGPKTITALQDWLGVEQTGELDATTTKALQAWVKTDQDGVIGKDTVKGLQHEVGASQNGSEDIDGSTVKVLQAFLNLY